ncbi:TPA: hypothetical protein ACTXXA_002009 [Legionella anisa]
MALSKLEIEIQQTRTSHEKTHPPKRVIEQFFESSLGHSINTIGKNITGTDDTSQIESEHLKLIRQFGKIKLDFENAAKVIISGNYTDASKENFEKLTMQYYVALKVVSDCLLHMAQQKRIHAWTSTLKVDGLHTKLKGDIASYQNTVNSVAIAVADHQLRGIKEGEKEKVRLDEIIPHIKAVYDKAYHDAHNPFWRWIKNIFKKSDRAQEVEFLNQISQHPQCTESVRLQAMRLVHNKIMETEVFGKEGKVFKGSKLGKLFEGVLKKGDFFVEKDDQTLVDFISTHDLKDKIPDSLKDYLMQTDETYLQKIKSAAQ